MLILASTSAIRAHILKNAGVSFEVQPPLIDEKQWQKDITCPPEQLPITLARAKALSVSSTQHNAWILGADQVLICEGKIYHKAHNRDEMREKLKVFRGKTHTLAGALTVAKNGKVEWEHETQAHMTMRYFSDDFLEHYMSISPPDILYSVGCYQYEGLGIQLFDHIEGDYFSILGLPLLPLLSFLREKGIIVA